MKYLREANEIEVELDKVITDMQVAPTRGLMVKQKVELTIIIK